jgi:hypothetical protein
VSVTDQAQRPALVILGDASVPVCEGDACDIPGLDDRTIVRRRLDADLV